ncbi:serine hydrolase [soil metagenome]
MSTAENRLKRVAAGFSGQLGVAARNLATGEAFMLNEHMVFPTASSIKVPILYEVFRQVEARILSLDDRIQLRASDITQGSGVLRDMSPGLAPTVHDLAMLMIIISDNTATNMVIELVGGVEPVNETMHERLGLPAIVLNRPILFNPENEDSRPFGVASPFSLMRLIELIASERPLGEEASHQMMSILRRQHGFNQLPRFLGYNPFAAELGEAQTFWIGNKTGSMPGVRADTGAIRVPCDQLLVYGVMTQGSTDTGFSGENEGEITNGLVGRILVEHWWPEGFASGQIGIDSPHLRRLNE